MNKLKTPGEWTAQTKLFHKSIHSDSTYNYDSAVYSKKPVILQLCWQPVESSSSIDEKGLVASSVYQAVVYDNKPIHVGDLADVETIGYLEIQSIKTFLSYRLITARTTSRRLSNV